MLYIDFGIFLEQIDGLNEEAMRAQNAKRIDKHRRGTRPSESQQDAKKKSKANKSLIIYIILGKTKNVEFLEVPLNGFTKKWAKVIICFQLRKYVVRWHRTSCRRAA